MELELENNLTNNLEESQNNFLDTVLGSAINNGIDIGLRMILPDFIEDTVIDLKNNLINYGLKEGISKTIESVIDTGKSVIGIFTGKFENTNQVNEAIKSGGVLDTISDLLDTVIDKVDDSGKVNSTILSLVRNGKDSILNNIEENIASTLITQINNEEQLNVYINNWKEYYNNQDFTGMEQEYEKIEETLEELIPLENTINNARNVEILHNLIKNNGQDFNLTEEEQELIDKLSLN